MTSQKSLVEILLSNPYKYMVGLLGSITVLAVLAVVIYLLDKSEVKTYEEKIQKQSKSLRTSILVSFHLLRTMLKLW